MRQEGMGRDAGAKVVAAYPFHAIFPRQFMHDLAQHGQAMEMMMGGEMPGLQARVGNAPQLGVKLTSNPVNSILAEKQRAHIQTVFVSEAAISF